MPFAQISFAVNAFEADWRGHERWLSRRLQDPRNCLQAFHEFLTALHLRSEGYEVEYLAAKRESQGGADLHVHLDGQTVVVECLLADGDAGRPIPFDSAEWLWLELSEFMAKREMHRVVLLNRNHVLTPADKPELLRELRACLEASRLGSVRLPGGDEVEPLDGDSPNAPLRREQVDQLRARLTESSGAAEIPAKIGHKPPTRSRAGGVRRRPT